MEAEGKLDTEKLLKLFEIVWGSQYFMIKDKDSAVTKHWRPRRIGFLLWIWWAPMVGTMVGAMVWWVAGIGLIPDIIAANPQAHTITHPPGTELAQFPNGNDFKIKLFK